jgi:hypothetical protein
MLGSDSSSMLPHIAIASSSSPALPLISSEHVHSSSSFESLANNPKVILDFFRGGEVIGSRLNSSFGVGGSIHIFKQWD